MITIGLTGGIASGKSKVAEILSTHGAIIIDADKIAHQTYEPGAQGYDQVVNAFGKEILDSHGKIDREILGKLAFESPESLSTLTSIVWPLTKKRITNLERELEEKGTKVAVLEAAVLYEAGWEDLTDEVWKITAPHKAAIKRLIMRNHLTVEEAEKRFAAHKDLEAHVDVVIENNGDLAELSKNVDKAWYEFKIRRDIEL